MGVSYKANYNITDLKPLDHVHKIKIPGLFISGKQDKIVPPQNVKNIYNKYKGQK